MKTFFYRDKDVLVICTSPTVGHAIRYVEARFLEDTGKVYFADEKNFVEYPDNFVGVLYAEFENVSFQEPTKQLFLKKRENVITPISFDFSEKNYESA